MNYENPIIFKKLIKTDSEKNSISKIIIKSIIFRWF